MVDHVKEPNHGNAYYDAIRDLTDEALTSGRVSLIDVVGSLETIKSTILTSEVLNIAKQKGLF